MEPAFSRSTALGRPSFTLNTTLHARPAARSTAAVPRVATSLEPQRRELARHRHGFRLVVLIYADEYGAFLRQRRARADLCLGKRFAEVGAHPHHFARRSHLRPQRWVHAREFVERKNRRFHEVLRHRQHAGGSPARVDLIRPPDTAADIVATLLYPVTDRPFRELYEIARGWSAAQRAEVLDVALESRTRRDDLLAGFHGGLYAYDFAIDIGAYRDLHRHRRCHKFRQSYSGRLGFDTPALVEEAGATAVYREAMEAALAAMQGLPAPGAHYLLPFGARGRFLFKMDFAEAEYISRVRSGVKGHFSYRQVAWEMKLKMEQLEPELGRLMQATPPWVEDMLKR